MMGVAIRRWFLKQLHTKDTLDALAVSVTIAVSDKGTKKVAKELRLMADGLDKTGSVRGWSFPKSA
jgi:hypothetical protein